MFEVLDRRTTLTGNQKRIVFAAVLGDMLEFFDYFLIGFVLAFVDRAVAAHLSANPPSSSSHRASAP